MKTSRENNFAGRGLAAGYAAGRAQVRKLNADRERADFIALCAQKSFTASGLMTDVENGFVTRIWGELQAQSVPNIFSGDANIIDSLRRKYQARLKA